MEITSTVLEQWLGGVFFPFCRIAGLFIFLPVLGTRVVPVRIRIGLSFFIALLVFHNTQPLAYKIYKIFSMPWAEIMGMVLEQLIIGIIIGFFIQLVFQIFSIMGELISSQAGFEFARMMDVMSGFDSPTVTQLYTVLVSLLFLSLDGHLVLIKFVVDSFRTLPMGSIRWMDFPLQTLVTLIQWAFERGLQVALPAVVSLLVTNMAFGVIVRISPQLNIFSLGFSVTLYLGMFAIYWTLGIVQPHFSRNLDENLNFLEHFLHD